MPAPLSMVSFIALRSPETVSLPPSRSNRSRKFACAASAAFAFAAGFGWALAKAAAPRPARAEHDDFGERIGAEAVGAVDRDAGAFAGGEQAGQGCRGVDIGVNAAHGVMHH